MHKYVSQVSIPMGESWPPHNTWFLGHHRLSHCSTARGCVQQTHRPCCSCRNMQHLCCACTRCGLVKYLKNAFVRSSIGIWLVVVCTSGWPTNSRDMWLWRECRSSQSRDVAGVLRRLGSRWQCLHRYDHQSSRLGVVSETGSVTQDTRPLVYKTWKSREIWQ